MICVFPSDATDFASNGLCVLTPTACSVTETLNGEWELSMTHPLDERDKWTYLQVGCIIRAPVPAAMTPRVSLVRQTTGWSVYTITTKSGKLNLRSGPGTNYKRLGQYAKGKEVVLIAKTNDSWYEVTAPDGKRGYMSTDYLTFARTEGSSTTATGQVVEPRQVRDQPFRIYRVVPTLTQVEVYARHIFYDLMDNMILSYKPEGPVGGTTAAHAVLDRCESAHDFTMYTDLTGTAEGLAFEHVNPVEAMLGDEGIVGKYHAELARDWYDVYLVNRVGRDTDVEIRQGKNLLGISYDVDESGVVTRIVPTGEDKDGHVLYLPEKHIDSPNIGAYPHVKWGHLAVSDAKEDDETSKSDVYRKLREAAQTELDNGCDLPTVTLDVDFLSVDDTEEYRDFGILHSIYLGDAVRVVVPKLGLTVALRMTQYTYDCLLRKYTACTLGTALDGVEGSMISASQLASGSIGGIKLAMGSIGTGHLQDGSVGSLQVRTAAIGSAHIQQAAIGEAHIQNAAITTAKIEDLAVTRGKIAEAAIGAAQIEDACITRAKIGEAAIGSAQIEEGIITSAHIGVGEIQEANIHDGAITHAKITDGAIRNAHIENGAIDSAKIADAAIQNAHIAGAAIDSANIVDGAIQSAKIADASVTRAKIADLAVGSAQIDDLAVTTAKIAQAAITNAQIANAAIDTAKIALGAITAALIEQGAVGTAQIADGSITDAKIVELTANKITAGVLSVERLVIRGSEQSIIYVINNMGELVSTQVDTIDGYVLTERTITADKIVAHSITAAEIAAKTITANEILSGTITGNEIAGETITGANIKAGTIDPTEFDMVQAEIARRKAVGRSYSGTGLFASKLYCADCGGVFGQKVWHSTDKYRRVVWQCNSKFKRGKSKCTTPILTEQGIQEMFLKAYAALLAGRQDIIDDCEAAAAMLTNVDSLNRSIHAENERLEQNTELIRAVVREHASIAQTDEEYHRKYDPLMEEHEAISAKLDKLIADREAKIERGKRLRSFLVALKDAPEELLAWDEQLWLLLVDHATVNPDGSVGFFFKNGTSITVSK